MRISNYSTLTTQRFYTRKGLFILMIYIFIYFSLLSGQNVLTQSEKKVTLREEIHAIYQSKGEMGLRKFLNNKKYIFDKYFVKDLIELAEEKRSEKWLKIAMVIAEKNGEERVLAYTQFKMGEYYLSINYYEKMYYYWDKALPVFEKIGTPKIKEYAKTMKKFLDAFRYNMNEPENTACEGWDLLEKHDNFQGQGSIYKTLSFICINSGDYTRAFIMLEKAKEFYKKDSDLNDQGDIYFLEGFLYEKIGDDVHALKKFNKALSCYEESENTTGQSKVYSAKGLLLECSGENIVSLQMYDRALSLIQKNGNNREKAELMISKGRIYQDIGKPDLSLKMYDLAKILFEKEDDSNGVGDVYCEKAGVYVLRGEYLQAIRMYEKALSYYGEFGHLHGNEFAYLQMGIIHSMNGNHLKELEMYEKALSICMKNKRPESSSYSLISKATVLETLGKKNEAIPLFEEGISELERIRQGSLTSKMKLTFMGKIYTQYEKAAAFMLRNGYNEQGFKYAESMAARVFLDQLAEGLVRLKKGIKPEFMQKKDSYIALLSNLEKEISEAVLSKDDMKLKNLNKTYQETESDYQNLLLKIRLQNPLYASVQHPQPITAHDLQTKILKKNELLLRYFIARDEIYVFAVSGKSLRVIEFNTDEKDINKMVAQYLKVTKAGKRRSNTSRLMKKIGRDFYIKLFQPIEGLLEGYRNIIIVPDGQLAKIPFETFVIGGTLSKPVYLLEKYNVKYIQSASVLTTLRKHYQRKGNGKRFIGFGDPVYDYDNYKQGNPEKAAPTSEKGNEIRGIFRGKYDREGGITGRLKASGDEVRSIAALFEKYSETVVVNNRQHATEENAKRSGMKLYDYIHFSCHGVLGDGFQSLVLSQIPGSQEDGYLTLNEIMNCDYNAQLVVLSACQTGTGKVERGEGVPGLTRAVMYAGTPAVVVSLWNVSDVGTKELMIRFYKNMLKKNMSKEDALRQAKLDLIKGETYSSPYYWSAFVLYGE